MPARLRPPGRDTTARAGIVSFARPSRVARTKLNAARHIGCRALAHVPVFWLRTIRAAFPSPPSARRASVVTVASIGPDLHVLYSGASAAGFHRLPNAARASDARGGLRSRPRASRTLSEVREKVDGHPPPRTPA